MVHEEWRRIFHDTYEVSNLGRVRRADAFGYSEGKLLKPATNRAGYVHLCLSVKGKYYFKYVHQLVAEAFLGLCPKGKQINHKDANKSNNTPTNLEYVTPQENVKHAVRLGLLSPSYDNPRKKGLKLTIKDVLKIRKLLKKKAPQKDIMKIFKLSQCTVSHINTRKTWRFV